MTRVHELLLLVLIAALWLDGSKAAKSTFPELMKRLSFCEEVKVKCIAGKINQPVTTATPVTATNKDEKSSEKKDQKLAVEEILSDQEQVLMLLKRQTEAMEGILGRIGDLENVQLRILHGIDGINRTHQQGKEGCDQKESLGVRKTPAELVTGSGNTRTDKEGKRKTVDTAWKTLSPRPVKRHPVVAAITTAQSTVVNSKTNFKPASRRMQCKKTLLGYRYAGTVSHTKNGVACQAWISQTPHRHSHAAKASLSLIETDGSVAAAKNYCRNPDKSPGAPWCYTTDPHVRWQYCDVPKCTWE